MDSYRTEEEQVEALRRWWDENGRSTIAAVIIALSVGFAWQTWKGYGQQQRESASDAYQSMLQSMGGVEDDEQRERALSLGEGLKENHGGSTYAQFAALHLARMAVGEGNLSEAEAQLRWVLGRADRDSDTARVAQLRLARVLASAGDTQQALAILEQGDGGPYRASWAVARGDILMMEDRGEEAREAYQSARLLAANGQGQVDLATLEQKLQSLTPVPPRDLVGEISGTTPEPAGEGDADGEGE